MGLSVTVLGCSGSYAAAGGACSGYLVRTATTSVWLDCGPGTLANLQEHVALEDLDAVVVSHAHADHVGELPVFKNACKYYLGREGLPVFAPSQVREVMSAFPSRSVKVFDWHIVADGDEAQIGDLSVRFSRTDHPVETLASVFGHAGQTLGYTADTGPGWSPAQLGPLDLLVGEATMNASDPSNEVHMSAAGLGAVARDLGVGRLVVTHVPPTSQPEVHRTEAEEAFGGPVELARVGRRFDLAS